MHVGFDLLAPHHKNREKKKNDRTKNFFAKYARGKYFSSDLDVQNCLGTFLAPSRVLNYPKIQNDSGISE